MTLSLSNFYFIKKNFEYFFTHYLLHISVYMIYIHYTFNYVLKLLKKMNSPGSKSKVGWLF